LKPFSTVKRVQTSQNTLEVLKNQNRGTLSHTPQAFNPVLLFSKSRLAAKIDLRGPFSLKS